MMKSEFIERTGFYPTEEEYRKIEAEYMETDINKDEFCKKWLKNGGIAEIAKERLYRAVRAETALAEAKVQKAKDDADYISLDKRYEALRTTSTTRIKELEKDIDEEMELLAKWKLAYEEEHAKLRKIQEAFAILRGED